MIDQTPTVAQCALCPETREVLAHSCGVHLCDRCVDAHECPEGHATRVQTVCCVCKAVRVELTPAGKHAHNATAVWVEPEFFDADRADAIVPVSHGICSPGCAEWFDDEAEQ